MKEIRSFRERGGDGRSWVGREQELPPPLVVNVMYVAVTTQGSHDVTGATAALCKRSEGAEGAEIQVGEVK